MLIILAALLMPAGIPAFERLTEEELDRTIASGVEPRPADERDESPPRERENSESEEEFTLFAYRGVLPIVMHHMTSTSSGPLGRNGRYALSPLDTAQTRKLPTVGVVLRLGPLPSSFLVGR